MVHTLEKPSAAIQAQLDKLRKYALAYPETHEDFPWGHSAIKVKGKAFVFLHADAEGLSISVKLPESNSLALNLPFAEPTGYGLGKSGWITARFRKAGEVPLDMMHAWLLESYRAIAPKRLSQTLSSDENPTKTAKKKAAKKKTADGTRKAATPSRSRTNKGSAKK